MEPIIKEEIEDDLNEGTDREEDIYDEKSKLKWDSRGNIIKNKNN